ncbi:hypothetical protein ACFU8Q_35245 [Streptomyces sp. NPDC057543]|uniref:hypothetical protein n=1 Tax=Streptomyces sp. NPDC057543 TaxID=3346163 RepID=UPI003692EFE1
MRSALVWTVRLSGAVGWIATGVACVWVLGIAAVPAPRVGPLAWGAVAAGCAVLRCGALWALRDRVRGTGVQLRKADAGSGVGEVLGLSLDSPSKGWVKARTGAVWFLVAFSTGALFAATMVVGSGGGKREALRDAGAEVSVATVVQRPRAVEKDMSEDVVRGYYSRLVVSVPGGPERLDVKGAYTFDRPRSGSTVDVLWASSEPELGGYVHDGSDLSMYAEGRWDAFPGGAQGRNARLALILVACVAGVFGLVLTLTGGSEALQWLAWYPIARTVRALATVVVFLGWRPVLMGVEPNAVEGLLSVTGILLPMLVYLFTSVGTIGDD